MDNLLEHADTLIDILHIRAKYEGARKAYTFLERNGDSQSLTYHQLENRVHAIARHLLSSAKPGDRILLFYPPGLEYICAFLGTIAAGMVAVPLYPPKANQKLDRINSVVANCDARLALTTEAMEQRIKTYLDAGTELSLILHATCGLQNETNEEFHPVSLHSSDLAFLQYTSGSTGTPKGVMVSHGNLMANEKTITTAFETTSTDICLSWLPMYHDMGLIGTVLNPLYRGYQSIFMAPLDFIRDPLSWLEAIGRFGVTLAGAPCFAYELCVHKCTPERLKKIDLSSWRVAFNGAEPVRAHTLDHFSETFAPAGFSANAHYPCYGMAEATLFVSGGQAGKGARVFSTDRKALQQNRVVPTATDGLLLTACGSNHGAGTLAIVNPKSMNPVNDNEVGEIWLSGDHIANGYWGRENLTRETFGVYSANGEGPYLRTGDMGFLSDGHLFITGRCKDLIIIRGRNYYPQDIEYSVTRSHKALRPDACAAFTIEHKGEEQLVVVTEVSRRHMRGFETQRVASDIRAAISAEFEIVLHQIVFARPGAVPKTSSGKIRRSFCREEFLKDRLSVIESLSTQAEEAASYPDEKLPPRLRKLRALAAEILRLPPTSIPTDEGLNRLGFDSVSAVQLQHEAEKHLKIKIDMAAVLRGASLHQLAGNAINCRQNSLPEPAPLENGLPLSYNQQAMWFLYKLAPSSSAYNMAHAMTIRSKVNIVHLERSLSLLLQRHPILRASYHGEGSHTICRVAPHMQVPFFHRDASNWSREEIENYLEETAQRPFSLEEGPIMRLHLLSLADDHHIMLLNMHHIAGDFWSQLVLMEDLGKLYAQKGRVPLPKQRYHYGHFVRWQQEYLNSEQGVADASWWKQQLDAAPTILHLPTDKPRPKQQQFDGAIHAFRIDASTTQATKKLAKESNATLFTVLYATYATLLYRYTGCDDLLIGTPNTGRARSEFRDIAGYFANPVVLRSKLLEPGGNRQPSFRQLVESATHTVSDALAHGNYPFHKLVEEMQPERDPSRSPLFQVMFVLQQPQRLGDAGAFALRHEGASIDLSGLPMYSRSLKHQAAQFDLTLHMAESGDQLVASFEYNIHLFDPLTVERIATHFQRLLETAIAYPETELNQITLEPRSSPNKAGLEDGPIQALALLRKGHPRHQRRIAMEQALAKHSGIKAVSVPPRDSGSPLIAFYEGSIDRAELHAWVSASKITPAPESIVKLPSLPRTPGGLINTDALAELPLIDQELLGRWRRQLSAHENVLESEILTHEEIPTPQRLHLNHLLPGFRVQQDNVTTTEIAQEMVGEITAGKPAYANGGPLLIPADAPTTFTEAIYLTVEKYPEKGIYFCESEKDVQFLSYKELLKKSLQILSGLRAMDLQPGGAVVLQISDLTTHFPTFWACVLGGIIPVCVAVAPDYTSRNSVVNKLHNTWKLLDKPPILTNQRLESALLELPELLEESQIKLAIVEELVQNEPAISVYPAKPDDVVFFQLTSGSTGVPKCIRETHKAIISHIHGAQAFNGYSPDDVDLNWLPMDHVVPILTCHLKNTYLGCNQIEIPTAHVLANPLLWLDLLEKHRATHTWSPNFGFKLVTQALAKSGDRKWDLTHLRFMMNAGEQVTLPVVSAFLEATQSFGVKPHVMQPAFGMAEVCTCMTWTNDYSHDTAANFFHKESLSTHLKEVSADHPKGICFIDLGPPHPGVEIRITDQQNKPLQEGQIGRFQIRGDVVTPGYYRNEAANAEAFVGDGWFNSGDLGFIRNGRLSLTGREKEMIIINGANFYCYEIEDIVNEIEGIIPTYVAAVGFDDPQTGTEGLAIFFSSTLPEESSAPLIAKIQRRVTTLAGITPHHVIPVPSEEFPKTTSGKIQRGQLKKQLASGALNARIENLDLMLGNDQTLPAWFYATEWRKRTITHSSVPKVGTTLILCNDDELAAHMHMRLHRNANQIFMANPGDKYSFEESKFSYNPSQPEHFLWMVQEIRGLGCELSEVFHLNCYGADPVSLQQDLRLGVYSLIWLIQALTKTSVDTFSPSLFICTSHGCAVKEGERPSPARAAIHGLVGSIKAEYPDMAVTLIDLPSESPETDASFISRERLSLDRQPRIAWRAGERLSPTLTPILRDNKQGEIGLKEGGQYLITGGLGSIATHLARFLLQHLKANLTLIGRTPLEHLSTQAQHALAQLKKEPGTVTYFAADITIQQEIKGLSDQIATLNGIFHLAGILESQPLSAIDGDHLQRVFAPKILGTSAMHRLQVQYGTGLKPIPLICFSSINSYFGGHSAAAYSAASAFQEAFCMEAGDSAWCLGYGPWVGTGMSAHLAEGGEALTRRLGYASINPKQGINSLLAVLAGNHRQVFIGLNETRENILSQLYKPPLENRFIRAVAALKDSNQRPHFTVPDCFGIPTEASWTFLDFLPRTSSGEVDKNVLRQHIQAKSGLKKPIKPITETQRHLAVFWKELLPTDSISINENFFEAGGHSLLATQFLARINEAFGLEAPIGLLFTAPTIAQLASWIDNQESLSTQFIPIRTTYGKNERLPASFAQQRLWFMEQLDQGTSAYHLHIAVNLLGPLQPQILESVINELVRRHEILRTVLLPGETIPEQAVQPFRKTKMERVDLSSMEPEPQQAEILKLAEAQMRQPFPLDRGPLFRTLLIKKSDDRHTLLFALHHAVADAWSAAVVSKEIAALYRYGAEDNVLAPIELPLQYVDYARWQHEWFEGDEAAQQRKWWLQDLSNPPKSVRLTPDRWEGGRRLAGVICRNVGPNLTKKISSMAKDANATPFMVLLATFQVLLSRLCDEDDLIVGVPHSGRNHAVLEQMVGCFLNSLPIRARTNDDPTFLKFLERVRHTLLGAYKASQIPFEKLVEELAPQREMDLHPLFDTLFNFINTPPVTETMHDVQVTTETLVEPDARFSTTLYARQRNSQLELKLVYRRDLYSERRMALFLDQYILLLEQICTKPTENVSRYFLSTAKDHTLIDDPSKALDFPKYPNVFQQVNSAAQDYPEAIAIEATIGNLTYQELIENARTVAQHLVMKDLSGETIALHGPRQPGLIVAMLGIMGAGSILLLIDPDLPETRKQIMLEEANAKTQIIIDQNELSTDLPKLSLDAVGRGLQAYQNQELPNAEAFTKAYIFFTSGSTGRPKAVLGSHQGLGQFIHWQRDTFNIDPNDRALVHTGLSFDPVLREIFSPLSAGATLVLPESGMIDAESILKLLANKQITLAQVVPSIGTFWLEGLRPSEPLCLRVLSFMGEPLPDTLVNRWRQILPSECDIYNLYGPTETTLARCYYRIPKRPKPGIQPVGRPLPQSQALVMDENLKPRGIGEPGEIVLRTPYRSFGYVNNPAEQALRFRENPYGANENDEMPDLLYRTGDRGRYRADGILEILGRIDDQIKIRGVRIEPGEIAALLTSHEDISRAYIKAIGQEPHKFLAAWYTSRKETDETKLRTFMRTQLPESMVPVAWMRLDHFPHLSNGKIDRQALPQPQRQKICESYQPPRNEMERIVTEVWAETLGLSQLGATDDFFAQGGHSLLAMRAVARLRQHFDHPIPLRTLFAHPTAATFVENLPEGKTRLQSLEPEPTEGPQALSFAQKRMWFLHQLHGSEGNYHIHACLRLKGKLDKPVLTKAANQLVKRHPALRSSFKEQTSGEIFQETHDDLELTITETPIENEAAIETHWMHVRQKPFTLENPPLVRLHLLQLSNTDHVLIVCMHHIIADAWSLGILIEELAQAYSGQGLDEKQIPSYSAYTNWGYQWLQSNRAKEERIWWQHQLANLPPLLELPTDRPRPDTLPSDGALHHFSIPLESLAKIEYLARTENTTLFLCMQAIFAALLSRLTNSTDIAIGTPVAGRDGHLWDKIIGLFVNTVVLRNNLSGTPDFRTLLRRTHNMGVESFAHETLPFEQVVDACGAARSTNHSPLFQVMFSLENRSNEPTMPGLALTRLNPNQTSSKFDMSLDIRVTNNECLGTIEFNRHLFNPATIARISRYFAQLLVTLAADPTHQPAKAPLMSTEERRFLTNTCNQTSRPFSSTQTVLDVYHQYVASQGDAPALQSSDGTTLTYTQLHQKVLSSAAKLTSHGVSPGKVVALCQSRSLEMIINQLAILWCGASYLPLDMDYPQSRRNFMLKDSGAQFIIGPVWKHLTKNTAPLHINFEGRNKKTTHRARPHLPAYIIYTSGTTGTPKGVMVAHSQLTNHAAAICEKYKLSNRDRVLQFASPAFDVATEEIYPTLFAGGTIVLRPDALHLDLDLFHKFLDANHVTAVNLPAPFWHEWARNLEQYQVIPPLRLVVVGSDKVNGELFRHWRQQVSHRVALHNAYGPTETTITSTVYTPEQNRPYQLPITPIGKPIGNVTHYVWDAQGNLALPGVFGELCIGGLGVATGYKGLACLTAERFVPDPYARQEGARLYRTGDRVRYLPDGNLQFAGRIDDQLKVRGFRLEPGEIENTVQDLHEVRDCAVLHHKGQLMAYVSPVKEKPITLWPSMGEYPVYDEILYKAMTNDESRNQRYRAAIADHVKGKKVLDIGTGKDALLARFCIEAGATKVYAIEAMDTSFEGAQQTLERLGLTKQVQLIKGLSTEVELPEKVDVCVSEIIGTIGSSEGVISVLNDARKRFLTQEGMMIPSRCVTKIAAVTLPDYFLQQPGFAKLGAQFTEAVFEHVGQPHDVRLCLRNLPPTCLISEEGLFEDLDFSAQVSGNFHHHNQLRVTKAGRMDGFLLWINLHTAPEYVIDVMTEEYSWLPVFFPVFSPGIQVQVGDELSVLCEGKICKNNINQDYYIRGTWTRGKQTQSFEYSSLHFETTYKRNPFYANLFSSNTLPVIEEERLNPAELKNHAQQRLPEYMVPQQFVIMDDLPKTPGGKIDRKALRDLAATRNKTPFSAPQGLQEENMAKVWCQVLGLDRLGRDDNFFQLGGDSILALRVVSLAREYNLRVTAQQLFGNQTLASFAAQAQKTSKHGNLPIIGSAPLTPIQDWFFQQNLPQPHHFNQALLLRTQPNIQQDYLAKALEQVVQHHDALRLYFNFEGGSWTQKFRTADQCYSLEREDLSYLPTPEQTERMQHLCSSAQARLHINKGPLFRALYIKTGALEDRLLLLCHHLVIDGVSWRILCEDLLNLLDGLQNGRPHTLPAKTTSFQQWSHTLQQIAKHPSTLTLSDHWRKLPSKVKAFPLDGSEQTYLQGTSLIHKVILDQANTRHLLMEATSAYRLNINELILAACVQTFADYCDDDSVFVEIESHGRHAQDTETDLSRTVGWFTNTYPVVLPNHPEIQTRIIAVKETLRAQPQHGLSFGILRHLGPEDLKTELAAIAKPAILFNYLGQWQDPSTKGSLRGIAAEHSGPQHGPQNPRTHILQIDAVIKDAHLEIHVGYHPSQLRTATVALLMENLLENLKSHIHHCLQPEVGQLTPADFPMAKLQQPQLNQLLAVGDVEDIYPLGPMQESLLHHAISTQDTAYFEQLVLDLKGELDTEAFEKAWLSVTRHPICRTSFHWKELSHSVQVVHPNTSLPWTNLDWQKLNPHQQEAQWQKFMENDRQHGFNLEQAPLMRFTLVRLAPQHWRFCWSHHHLLLDGWSSGHLLSEILTNYQNEEQSSLAAVPFSQYLHWLSVQDQSAAKNHWKNTLAGFSAPTTLPSPWETLDENERGHIHLQLDTNQTQTLIDMCRENAITLNTLFSGAWAQLLGRHSNTSDVVFGTTFSGRSPQLPGSDKMVGLMINTLPIRAQWQPDTPTIQWLKNLQQTNAIAENHGFLPLAEIQTQSDVKGNIPLCSSLMVFENYPLDSRLKQAPNNLQVQKLEGHAQTNFPLMLVITPGDRLHITLTYDNTIGDTLAKTLLSRLHHLIENFTQASTLQQISLEPEAQLKHLRQSLQGAATEYPREACIHHLFEDQAARNPQAIALNYPDQKLTYGQLESIANLLAHQLRSDGIKSGDVVAIFTDRTPQTILAMLAVLKVGAVYLPLDPSHPPSRLNHMLNDSDARLILGNQQPTFNTGQCPFLQLPSIEEIPTNPGRLNVPNWAQKTAYLLYTSGSTGTPKGVRITHRGIARLVCNTNYMKVETESCFTQLANASFDAATFEVWGALANGAQLVGVPPHLLASPKDLANHLQTHKVTHFLLTTALFNQFAAQEPKAFKHMPYVFFGGEAADPASVRTILEQGPPQNLIHAYGPTENTTYSTCDKVHVVKQGANAVPIGRPISNSSAAVLDRTFHPTPEGIPGELCLGGDGLALGYHLRPRLTAEQFVPDPHGPPGSRLYKSGDLVRSGPDGNLIFVGRTDHQVKIRGYRIEPEEINAHISNAPNVSSSKVLVRHESGEPRLIAYIVPSSESKDLSQSLRTYLRQHLPEYMVPAAFISLSHLPLTPNGKVDFKALPIPDMTTQQQAYTAPRNETEEKVAAIFAEVLNLERVGIFDDFFDLGGHSLTATRVLSQLRQTFEAELPMAGLFEDPTAAGLASLIETALWASDQGEDQPLDEDEEELEI